MLHSLVDSAIKIVNNTMTLFYQENVCQLIFYVYLCRRKRTVNQPLVLFSVFPPLFFCVQCLLHFGMLFPEFGKGVS